MSTAPTHVLLVEDNHEYAWMLQLVLASAGPDQFKLTHVIDLEQAFQHLRSAKFDIVLLDLSLPDSTGYDTFQRVFDNAVETPIVVMTAIDDREMALKAVREGAQDYLVKSDMDVTQLVRSIKYAIERHQTILDIKRQSLLDDLTGLLNRRGFISLAEQHIKIAQRAGRSLLLFFADLDGLKQINDTFGHPEGDQALKNTAAILKDTFRSSDIIARMGGDEFTILAIDAPGQNAEQIVARLRQNINQLNSKNPKYVLSMSIGMARFKAQENQDLEHMLAQADRSLYAEKRNKHIQVIKTRI